MKVYIPIYSCKDGYTVLELDVLRMRTYGQHTIFINGQSYRKETIFKTEAAAQAYINKDYGTAYKERLEV